MVDDILASKKNITHIIEVFYKNKNHKQYNYYLLEFLQTVPNVDNIDNFKSKNIDITNLFGIKVQTHINLLTEFKILSSNIFSVLKI